MFMNSGCGRADDVLRNDGRHRGITNDCDAGRGYKYAAKSPQRQRDRGRGIDYGDIDDDGRGGGLIHRGPWASPSRVPIQALDLVASRHAPVTESHSLKLGVPSISPLSSLNSFDLLWPP